jgi:hypothetical protein
MGLVQPSRDFWCLRLLRPPSPFNSLRSFYFCSSFCILRTHIGIEDPSPSHYYKQKKKKRPLQRLFRKALKQFLLKKTIYRYYQKESFLLVNILQSTLIVLTTFQKSLISPLFAWHEF